MSFFFKSTTIRTSQKPHGGAANHYEIASYRKVPTGTNRGSDCERDLIQPRSGWGLVSHPRKRVEKLGIEQEQFLNSNSNNSQFCVSKRKNGRGNVFGALEVHSSPMPEPRGHLDKSNGTPSIVTSLGQGFKPDGCISLGRPIITKFRYGRRCFFSANL